MKRILITILFLAAFVGLRAQTYTLSGHIVDATTGEMLIGATLFEASSQTGTSANGYGFYSLRLPAGKHKLQCAYLGYITQEVEIQLDGDKTLEIKLEENAVGLGEVTVEAASVERPQRQNEFNAEMLTINQIRKLPSVFGEADIIKAVQMQSGVKTIGDASSGLLVRGGTNDQNLILIDEAPIYNPSHLFGMISIFNPEAVNQVTLYKSNMPAQYGGRVSAVLDCKMKEGNMNRHGFSVALSPFAATLTANGPIAKEQASYLISARRSFFDLFVEPNKGMPLVPTFYDLNAKINTKIGQNDRLYLSFYRGHDVIDSNEGLHNNWGNTSGTLRWTHNFGSRWFLNTAFIVSDYRNDLNFIYKKHEFNWHTGLSDLNLKAALSYYIAPDCELRIGAGAIRHAFVPGESDSLQTSLPHLQAMEYSAFVLNDWKPLRWLGFNYGLHLSAFQPLDSDEKVMVYPEPRVSMNVMLNDDASLKAAYSRNVQYIQVLQNNSLNYTSLETWFPAVNGLKPVIADVVSAGFFLDFAEQFSTSVELYYKKGQNQIDFIDHAQLISNPNVLSQVRSGNAMAYGVEFNLSKNVGKFTGAMSYTYSRVTYTIPDINDGNPYSALSDIPHDFRINGSYQFTPHWSASAAWQYSSGHPVTLPVGFYEYMGQTVPIYTERNASRTPAYHRLDLSCAYQSPKYKNGFNWTASFGLFNAYNRLNPLGYQFETNTETGEMRAFAYSMFGILPNVSVRAGW
ncbi:MAG: TonB-dependent receptor [Bacteroidales bacterium]|nr:TonB-dependent receptor [Bacteroidales bacterium]